MKYSLGNMPKVGARVMLRGDGPFTVSGIRNGKLSFSDRDSGDWAMWSSEHTSACYDAPPASPIREVTKRELVDGEYGSVTIKDWHMGYKRILVELSVKPSSQNVKNQVEWTRSAAKTLTEIADFLESQTVTESTH